MMLHHLMATSRKKCNINSHGKERLPNTSGRTIKQGQAKKGDDLYYEY